MIRATRIQSVEYREKAPCRRCGIERTTKPGDTGYCTSCISVLRHDPGYFHNLDDPEAAQARFRHHTQKTA